MEQKYLDLEKYNIIELLGLEKMSVIEQDRYILEISKVAITRAFVVMIEDGLMTKEGLQKIEEQFSQGVNSGKIQEEILSSYPDSIDYVRMQTNDLKIAAIKKQTTDFINYIEQISKNPTEKLSKLNLNFNKSIEKIQKLEKAIIENDQEIFEGTLPTYRGLRIIYKFS